MRDKGRYHRLPWGGGQITISKEMAKDLDLKDKDKLLVEYDTEKKELLITKL